ncbi:MAG: 2'-5' RNA ligase family protein [Ornithinimicrobium sp.]
MQSVELVLDDAADAAVRAQWAALAAAGLPSQADHTSASNAPHVTVGVADAIDETVERQLEDAAAALPLPAQLGPLVLLGGRRVVLARMVVVTKALLALHHQVSRTMAECPGRSDYLRPGQWVPHVTLAARLAPEMVPEALEVLREHRPAHDESARCAVGLRRWDSVARRKWIIGR